MNLIKNIFQKVQNVDSDCKLNSSQFVGLMATSDDEDMKRFLKQIFSAFNENNDGVLDFEEIVMMMSTLIRGTTMERLKAVFQICDKDKSGQIEKKELVDTFKNMLFLVKDDGVKKNEMEEVAGVLFDETDKDGNGHLTKDEFLEAFYRDKRIQDLIKVIFVAVAKALVDAAGH